MAHLCHPERVPEDVAPAVRATIKVIDTIADWSGRIIAWLIIPMTLAVTYEVVARHFFRAPTIWTFDVTYMLYGTHFMLGTAYTLMRARARSHRHAVSELVHPAPEPH